MSRKKNSRQWARLRILCSGGLHLMTLIPDALELVRELIPNSASQLFLHAGRAPDALHEANVLGVLPPPNGYFYGDSRDFGVPPAQARARAAHVLEVGLGPAAGPLGTLTLLRDDSPPFDADDEEDLGRVAHYFDHALRNAAGSKGGAGNGLPGVIEDEAMLLATTNGDILFLSDSAGARSWSAPAWRCSAGRAAAGRTARPRAPVRRVGGVLRNIPDAKDGIHLRGFLSSQPDLEGGLYEHSMDVRRHAGRHLRPCQRRRHEGHHEDGD